MQKVLVTSTRWGHASIAKGIKETLDKKYETSLGHLEVEPFSRVGYRIVYKLFPWFFKIVFFVSQYRVFRQLFFWYVERDYKPKLEKIIKEKKPDIILNVYFAFNSSLESLSKKYNFRLINVLADPWTFSKILVAENQENVTFDEYSLKKLKALYPKANGVSVGWFIENKYHLIRNTDRASLRKKLQLNPNIFTLCVVSGSEGTFNIFKILRTFLSHKYDMQVVILCGNNSEMFTIVKTLKSISERIHGPNIFGIAYTENMHEYLRAADLVIGKAGPNTMFETVSVLTPFFAISHISGQEDGNLDIIKRYGIGFVEENPRRAAKKLMKIVENPKMLTEFSEKIQNLANYCQESRERLLKLLAQ